MLSCEKMLDVVFPAVSPRFVRLYFQHEQTVITAATNITVPSFSCIFLTAPSCVTNFHFDCTDETIFIFMPDTII